MTATSAPRKVGRPATGQVPGHNVRVPAGVWAAGQATARASGTTLSDAIREFVAWYARQPGAHPPTRP